MTNNSYDIAIAAKLHVTINKIQTKIFILTLASLLTLVAILSGDQNFLNNSKILQVYTRERSEPFKPSLNISKGIRFRPFSPPPLAHFPTFSTRITAKFNPASDQFFQLLLCCFSTVPGPSIHLRTFAPHVIMLFFFYPNLEILSPCPLFPQSRFHVTHFYLFRR